MRAVASPYVIFARGAAAALAAFALAGCSAAEQTPAALRPPVRAGALDAKPVLGAARARYGITAVSFSSDFPSGFVEPGSIAGVDENGDMAGVGIETDNYDDNCVYFNGQKLLDLSGTQGGFCALSGMNASGTAVGEAYNASDFYQNYGVIYAQGDFSEITSPVNGFLGVNTMGTTIASVPTGGFAVYSLTTSQVLYDLYDPSRHCAMAVPYAINDRGVVFGYDQCQGATRYETVSSRGVFNYLTLPSGYTISSISPRLSDSGGIVLNKTSGGHPYLWSTTHPGHPVDLGALASDPNGTYYETSMNARTIVGITSDNRSWIWEKEKGMQDLADLVPPNPYGWIAPEALDARGDIGAVSNTTGNVWLYLKR